jgi:hypothetical protein
MWGDLCRNARQRSAICVAALLATISLSAAQSPDVRGKPPSGAQDIIIGGESPPSFQRCIEVEISGDKGFGCLNQQLKREVDRVNPPLASAPFDARSPDVRVGNVNEAAVRQQYGPNYGRSVVPFRPPVPVFSHR